MSSSLQTLRYTGKYIGLVDALYDAVHQLLPAATIASVGMDSNDLVIEFDPPISPADQDTLASFVNNYTDPPFYLRWQSTENLAMSSAPINSSSLAFMQAFMAEPSDAGMTQHLRPIVRCTTDNLPYFATWDSNADPITATICAVDWQTDAVMSSATVDLSDIIAQRWVPLATSSNPEAAAASFSNMQLYGPCVCKPVTLSKAAPSNAAIWHLRGYVSNSNAHVSINGLQRLHYTVEYPQ